MKPAPLTLADRWDTLAATIASYRDVLDVRAVDDVVPPGLVARGWAAPLLSLDEAELAALEIAGCDGDSPAVFPPTLRALHDTARAVCAVPALETPPSPPRRLRRLETPRKRAQVEALGRLTLPLARTARRVVEVGSGHGHLAREVAAQIERPVVGLERDGAISATARKLAHWDRLSFEEVDVLRDGIDLERGDCALGLHACGELGDALVASVAERAESLVLVGCCLQKQRAEARLPMQRHRAGAGDVVFAKSLLGLSNFTPREQGVEATREENVAARERRHALHALLVKHAGPLRFGAEMDGLHRRAAHGDLASMVARAFAIRGAPVPAASSVAEAARDAKVLHDRLRRLSLPRLLLGRVIETFVAVDRALHLESAGFSVTLGIAFPKEISARNLTVVATRAEGGFRAASTPSPAAWRSNT